MIIIMVSNTLSNYQKLFSMFIEKLPLSQLSSQIDYQSCFQILQFINRPMFANYQKQNCLSYTTNVFLLILLQIFITAQSFQFTSLRITANPPQINSIASYQVNMIRQLSGTGTPTPWNTQAVPSGSNISIIFPQQYQLFGSETCTYILINSQLIFSFTCTINTAARQIIFEGAITQDKFISIITLQIGNVNNPSPALQTGSFQGLIGSDTSANDNASTLILQPAALQSLQLSFEPTTVNTTGSLLVSVTPKNSIPAGGSIQVTFPSSLKWAREASSANFLPIQTSMSCSALTNTKFTITCQGDSETATVTAMNLFDEQILPSTKIQFTINQLFSPPTTQPIDSITVTTYTGSPQSPPTYQIDTLSATIQGLTAQDFTQKLTLSTTQSPIINTNLGLSFIWTLTDTLTKNDYFTIDFPDNTEFNYITYFPIQLNLTNFTYSQGIQKLTFYQSSSSSNKQQSLTVGFTLLSYTTPSSVQTTPPFTLSILNNGYLKAQATATITTLPKQYISLISTVETTINAKTSYQITFDLEDSLSNSGYFIIRIPEQLTLDSVYSITITGDDIGASPQFQQSTNIDGISIITVTNLNSSTSNIPIQDITIIIDGLIQPSSVKQISQFSVEIYYSSSDDLVAEAVNSNTISITPGVIQGATVDLSSNINSDTQVVYTFNIPIANQIQTDGQISITIPEQIAIQAGGLCSLNSVQLASDKCIIDGQVIKFITEDILDPSTVILTYSKFTNFYSTKPIYISTIQTKNSLGQTIDVLSTDQNQLPQIKTQLPSAINQASLIRGNSENSRQSLHQFNFTQIFAILQNQISVQINFPDQITIITSELSCLSLGVSVSCSYADNTLTVIDTAISQNNHQYSFTIANGIYNPLSLQPTTSISISTFGKDSTNQYFYSMVDSGLTVTNTFASSFDVLLFQYSNRILSSSTGLTLNLDFSTQTSQIQATEYFLMTPAVSFDVKIGQSITCTSSTTGFTPTCSLQQNSVTNSIQILISSATGFPTSQFQIIFQSFITPDFIPTDFTSLTSFTNSDYIISSSNNLIKFETYCTFPCKTCNQNQTTSCLSCYDQDLTNRIYLHEESCLVSCPSQYYEDIGNLICQACLNPCYQCDTLSTNCTYCDLNSTYIYLNISSESPRIATCLSQCPIYMYGDITQIPYLCTDCISPCLQCSDSDTCESCIQNYFLYQNSCLSECPIDVTVEVIIADGPDICQNCNPICLTCQITAETCTSCFNDTALYQNTCISQCPGNDVLVIENNQCVSCIQQCETCSILKENCTSCDFQGSQFKYFYQNSCLISCPNFYYSGSFGICMDCTEEPSRNCKNCSGPSQCLSCDAGFVFLQGNCLDETPQGYLNISGIAIPCQGDCQTCSVTLTNCTSCKTLNLFGNTCKQNCPQSTISLDQICQECQYPCQTCEQLTSRCLSCIYSTNTSIPQFYLNNFQCVQAENCPSGTYANQITRLCTPCQAPCLNCETQLECISCRFGYFFVSDSKSCQTTCPFGSVGINRVCQQCQFPCKSCQTSVSTCLSCFDDYYYNHIASICVTQCPSATTIANQTSMQCQFCQSPCKTCFNTTSTCFSCISKFYLYGQQCLETCPDTFYGSGGKCLQCTNSCKTCRSPTECLSCHSQLFLFSSECINQCPDSHAFLLDGQNVCTSCQKAVSGCSNCTETGQCYQCYSPFKYFQSQCLDQCPEGYEYNTTGFECVQSNETDVVLEQNLSSDNIFPMPFTVLSGVCIIAACMSKLQNRHTYLIGLIYSFMGLIQTLALGYLIFRYWQMGSQNDLYDSTSWLLLLVAAGIIYFLNIISFLIQTPLLILDSLFQQWLSAQKSHNKCFFSVILIISLLINYKLKLLPFTKLFKFFCMSALLSSVTKFRIFNVFSFFGIIAEGLGLYICFVSLFDKNKLSQTGQQTAIIQPNFLNNLIMFYALLDVIVVFIINIILAIAVTWKKNDFFEQEQDDGYILQKKINMAGQDYSKEALEGQILDEKFLGAAPYDDSYGAFDNAQIQEYSLEESLTGQQVSKIKSNIKVYFADNQQNGESSNPFRREPENTKVEGNIFSQISQEDHHNLSQHQPKEDQLDISQAGGSQKMIIVNSPGRDLSPTKRQPKQTVKVMNPSKVSNFATDNQAQQDVGQKISQRQLQLDQLRKQMQQKQRLRKQRKKSRKKLKKTIEMPDSPDQLEYEEISIKQTLSNHSKTIQETKKNSTLIANSQSTNKPQLKQQQAQQTIDDIIPKDKAQNNGWTKIVEDNRENLPIFTAPSKELQTYSREDSYEQEKGRLPSEEGMELQAQEQQPSITKSYMNIMKKSTIKFPKYEQASQNYDTVEDGKVIFDKTIRSKSPTNNHHELSIDYQENLDKELITEPTKKNKAESIQKDKGKNIFDYQQKESQKMEGGNTKMNFYNSLESNNEISPDRSASDFGVDIKSNHKLQQKKKYESAREKNTDNHQQKLHNFEDQSLEDSYREDNQRINERPLSAVRGNGLNNNQALMQILQQAQKDKVNRRRNYHRKLPEQQDVSPAQKMFQRNYKQIQKIEGQDQQQKRPHSKSKVYLAGLRQVQQDNLKKKTIHNSVRISQDDSEIQPSQNSKNLEQSRNRNKSLNTAPFRKYTSKDISIDEMSFSNMQPFQSNYHEMLNPRYHGSGMSEQKPGSSGGTRHLPQGLNSQQQLSNISRPRIQSGHYNNQNNLKKYYNYNLGNKKYEEGDDELQKYYMKQKMNHSKSKEKDFRSKQKEIIRQRSLEDTKRYKQLQKIYGSKNK